MSAEADKRLDVVNWSFKVNTTAGEAEEFLRRRSVKWLHHLLRHHTEPPGHISNTETWQRDAFDFLLEFYSILEIGLLVRQLPDPLPSKLVAEARKHVSHPAVQTYYEENYPLLLPHFFRLRLEGKNHLHQPGDRRKRAEAFSEFVGLVRDINDDDEVETFQWFLEYGVRDGYNIDDTLAVIKNQNKFNKHFFRPVGKRDGLDMSLHGFSKFLDFCLRFDALLRRTADLPLLQSGMWHFFAYWFDQIGEKVGEDMEKAAAGFLKWSPEEQLDPRKAKKEVERFVKRVSATMRRLTSDRYGRELKKRAMEIG